MYNPTFHLSQFAFWLGRGFQYTGIKECGHMQLAQALFTSLYMQLEAINAKHNALKVKPNLVVLAVAPFGNEMKTLPKAARSLFQTMEGRERRKWILKNL